MTEGQFKAKLVKALKKHTSMGEAVVWQHNDRYKRGVLDVSVSVRRRTIWLEAKVANNEPTKIQRYYMNNLRSGALLVRANVDGKHAWLNDNDFLTFDELVQAIVAMVTS